MALTNKTTVINPSRPKDYIYDTTYTASATKDVFKAHQAATSQNNVQQVPVFNNLFADARNYPRSEYRMKHTAVLDPIPSAVIDAATNTMRQAAPIATQTLTKTSLLGHDRAKFFKRPLVPFLNPVPPEVLFAPVRDTKVDPLMAPTTSVVATSRTVSIQTDYRESEAQTDPYTPDYIIHPNSQDPETLTISSLTYGHGLPASLQEVEMIERARKKRIFEASLPPLSDESLFGLRKQMMQEQELAEWRQRESEIDEMQARRIELIRTALLERDVQMTQLGEVRLEHLRQRKLMERDLAMDEIQKRRIKTLRILSKRRQQIDPVKRTRDIVSDYADFGSTVYAPLTRDGAVKTVDIKHVDDISTLNTLQGLESLSAHIPSSLLSVSVTVPEIASKSFASRKGQLIASDLEKLDALIQAQKTVNDQPLVHTRVNMYKKLDNLVRPPTPTVEEEQDDSAEEAAIILLQRLLRGRAQQNMMFEAKEHRLALICELRITEEISDAPVIAVPFGADQDVVAGAAIDLLQGYVVAQHLDSISKELVHLNEERDIGYLAAVAEQTRRDREAQESGRRQAEQLQRRLLELERLRVSEVVTQTTDAYLGQIMNEVQNQYCDKVAHSMAEIQNAISQRLAVEAAEAAAVLVAAAEVAKAAAEIIAHAAHVESEVREFMRSFILPAVCERVLLVRGGFTAGLVGFSPDEMIHRQQANQVVRELLTSFVLPEVERLTQQQQQQLKTVVEQPLKNAEQQLEADHVPKVESVPEAESVPEVESMADTEEPAL